MNKSMKRDMVVPMEVMEATKPTTKPAFEHNCTNCVFLGQVVVDERIADLYVCEDRPGHKAGGTLVWRHSDAAADYGSSPAAYITALSGPFAMAALALYVKHLGATGANWSGQYFNNDEVVLDLRHK